jgi:hypothetical protein
LPETISSAGDARDAAGKCEVFAGGTRLEAARVVGLEDVPVLVHEGLSDEEVARRADLDNENDEYHEPVPVVDVWAEYHRLCTFRDFLTIRHERPTLGVKSLAG